MKQQKLLPVKSFSPLTLAVAMLVLTVATATTAEAQTFSVLYTFGSNAGDPYHTQYPGLIAQGRDGDLYSTSLFGGNLGGWGDVFTITPSGTLTSIHSFSSAAGTGNEPHSGLVLGVDGNFYGTTKSGGAGTPAFGTVFKITGTTLKTLYNFGTVRYPKTEGTFPIAPPVQGRDGNFYGTTPSSNDGNIDGIAYQLTSGGKRTLLYLFTTSGYNPQAPLILGADGNFYGTTAAGGKTTTSNCFASTMSCGTVFKMTPAGRVTFLYQFDQVHGAEPLGPLVQGIDGNFYGTTAAGGDANGDGVIFKLTSQGKITILHTFNGTDGKQPTAGLVQASDGNFYGVASAGGAKGFGTLFKVTSSGVFSVLHDFDSTNDGANPEVTLVQHTNGILYGDTVLGGSHNIGTLYSWDSELPAFIKLVSASGTVGASIGILGQGFTGTTSVSFNGSSAKFTVTTDTYLTVTVPTAATTGTVTVTTPTGILTSNQSFVVLPSITSFSPTSGKVATSVVIMGGGMTNASQVTFGGVKAATFTVNSTSKVTATVPTGAKTGKIGITTPEGTATSSGTFTVLP